MQTETSEKMCVDSIEAAPPLLHCMCSWRGPGQTITLPYQMSWETDVLGSCANSPLFPSAAPVSHPGDSRELHEHHLLRGKHHCWNNPLQIAIHAAIWHTSVCVLSQNKNTELQPKAKIISWGLFFVQILQIFSTTTAHIIWAQKICFIQILLLNITAWRVILKPKM